LRSSSSNEDSNINRDYNSTSRSLAIAATKTTTTTTTTPSYLQKDYTNIPQVFLLGAQKAGTESMFDVLIKHDKLCGSNGEGSGNWKESHFFRGLNFNSDGTLKKPELWDLYQSGYDDPKCMNGNNYNTSTNNKTNNYTNKVKEDLLMAPLHFIRVKQLWRSSPSTLQKLEPN
jgi:hypothetical protein